MATSVIHIREEDNGGMRQQRRNKTANIGNQNHPIHVGPSLIHFIEEGDITYREGTPNRPINVNSVGSYRGKGSPNEPICLEDEVEVIGGRNYPIPVDRYEIEDIVCFEVDPFDPKGKKPKRERKRRLNTPIVIREVGESSNAPPKVPDAYCSICMEAKFKHECFIMKNCSHLYCFSCIGQYVEVKVEENVTSIACPDPGCKDGYLEPEMCRNLLKPEVFNRWGIALCEAIIGSMKFYCPYKDCSALLIDERAVSNSEVITNAECPHCFRMFCAQCKVPWHAGVSCEEFSKLGEDERSREDIMLRKMAESSKWQRCPKCNFYVERISGCMFIKCRCGHQFCYGCATTMTMDHYCKKCKR